jgi:hypothetical protein
MKNNNETLGGQKNGEKIIAQRVQTCFWTGKQYVKNLTASDLRREAQEEFERDRRDDMMREARLDRDR